MNNKIPKTSTSKTANPINLIVDNFKKTGKYSSAFLLDLKEGLIDLEKSRIWKSK
jgi:hypothetical protein